MEENTKEKRSFFKNKTKIFVTFLFAVLAILTSILVPTFAGGGSLIVEITPAT